MSALWKILRRLVFLLLLSFLMLNTLTYVILNSARVQRSIVGYLNTNYLAEHQLRLKLGSLSLNFLTSALNLNDVKLFSEKSEVESTASAIPVLQFESVALGIEPLRSYLTKTLRLSYLKLEGAKVELQYNTQGELQLPFVVSKKNASPPQNFAVMVKQLRALLPAQIEFIDSEIVFGETGQKNYQQIGIKQVFIKNPPPKKVDDRVQIIVELTSSEARFPALESNLKVDEILATLQLQNSGQVDIERLNIVSNVGSFEAKGIAKIDSEFKKSKYQFKANGKVDFKQLMALFGTTAQGNFNFTGNIDSPPNALNFPLVRAELDWQKASLEGYDLYTGKSQVNIANRVASLRNAEFKTPKGAQLTANAEFELFGAYKFKAKCSAQKLAFSELMAGLTAPTSVVEFDMDSELFEVEGHIQLPSDKVFGLKVVGPVNVSQLIVPSLHKPGQNPLAPCLINLVLFSDAKTLDFQNSTASCNADRSDTTTVEVGRIVYANGDTQFKFKGTNLALDQAEYFLGAKTSGRADFDGSLKATPGNGLVFSANTRAQKVLLYGVEMQTLEGNWRIDERGVHADDVDAFCTAGNNSARIHLDRFALDFKDLKSEIVGHADGDLSAVTASLGSYLPAEFPTLAGTFRTGKIQLSGPLTTPQKWNLNGIVNASDFSALGMRASRFFVSVSCTAGVCRDSRILGTGVTSVEESLSQASSQVSLAESALVLEVSSLSFDALDFRGELRKIPLQVQNKEGSKMSTIIDARFDARGPWKKWEGTLTARADDMRIGNNVLGPLSLNAISHGGGDVNVVAYARYEQVLARLRLPHNLRGSASLYIRTKSFDGSFWLPVETRSKYNLFSLIDSELLFEGPSFLLEPANERSAMLDKWKGEGKITRLAAQYRQIRLNLRKSVSLKIANSKFRVDDMLIETNKGSAELNGEYDFANREVNSTLEAKADLDILQDFASKIGSSVGQVEAQLEFTGKPEKLSVSGTAQLKGEIVNLKEFSPPLTDLEGEFNFDDDKIEIQYLRAKKGGGELDLAGSVNWSRVISGEQKEPGLALQLSAKRAQVRIPAPVLEAFDTVIDGKVELSGSAIPYNLSGQIKVVRSRAYKDISCSDILRAAPERRESELRLDSQPFALINLSLLAEESITIQTQCFRGRLSSSLKLGGSTNEPALSGNITVDAGTLTFLKSRFDVKKAELVFDNPVRVDPKIDAQLVSPIEAYRVYVSVDGPLSKPRTNLWSDPSTSPDGDTLGRGDILRMLSSGQAPRAGSGQTTGQAFASQVAGYVYGATSLDESLSQAFSRLTGGFIDDVQLQPLIENGQTKWKARVSRSLGDRLNLGLDIEQSPQVNNQSLTGTVFINESVNVLGGFDRKSSQSGSYSELSGGLRFQFGSK